MKLSDKEETKKRILQTLQEHKVLARSALALYSNTAFYTIPRVCEELEAEGKIEILFAPKATYYRLKKEEAA